MFWLLRRGFTPCQQIFLSMTPCESLLMRTRSTHNAVAVLIYMQNHRFIDRLYRQLRRYEMDLINHEYRSIAISYFLTGKYLRKSLTSLDSEKDDVIGNLEVPCDVLDLLFFVIMDTLVRFNRAISLDFEKYVAKGVIGYLSALALYTSGAKLKMKSGISSPDHLQSKIVRIASIMRMSTLCGYLVMTRPGARLKNNA